MQKGPAEGVRSDLGRQIQIWWLGSKGVAVLIRAVRSGSNGSRRLGALGGGATGGARRRCAEARRSRWIGRYRGSFGLRFGAKEGARHE